MRRDLKWLLVLLLSLTLWAVGCDDDGGGGGDEDTDAVTDTENDNGDVEGDTDQINEIEDTDTIDDTDTDTDVVDPEIVVCDNVIPTPSSGTCEVTEGDTSLLLEGTVLAGQTIYQNGRVVVDNTNGSGRITCVGCDCEAPSATRVSCPEGVISPGLINTHDHITFCELAPADHGSERYEHRHDWRKGLRGHTRLSTPGQDEVRWGEVRMLLSGVTSITGSGGSDGLIRNLDKSNSVNADVDYRTFPLGDSDGTQLSSGCGYPSIDSESRAAGAGIYHAHISEGIDGVTRNEFACTSSSQNGGHDLVNGNTSIVHGVGLSASDIQHIADEGAKLIWSPRSNVDLYGNTAPILLYKNLGVTISLGTDWAASGSMNMLRELQCADYLNTNHYNNAFTDFDLFMMATYNGAVATGTDTSLGLIANGYLGDISIYAAKGRSPYRAVIDADIQDVTLVMRGGYTLYGDTAVVQGLMGSTASQCDSMDVCDSDKLLCISPDTGETLSALEGSVASDAYGLFYCGIPMNEPSCEPFRGNEYPSSDPNDMDGDGIADADDNCPNVFNPIRPVIDGGVQPDADSDGEGDACDICPFNEGSVCDAPTPGDRDRDGTPDLEDNCPSTPNEDQADGDEDGIGDVCDPCPEDYSPAGQACPATIYQIKTGEMPMGNSAAISGAVVTAVAGNGVFVQVDPDSADYEGIDNSGIFIYFGSGSSYTAERGDVVNASGSIDAFFDQIQLSNLTSFEVVSSGPLIAPHVVSDPSTIATGGSAQAALEGVLVTVTDVTVTDIAPAPGYDGHNTANEFLVTGGLRIADYFYAVEPFPELDAHFDSITGVLHWGNSVSNLEPRDIFDVISGPPAVDHIEPAYGYLLEGDTASPLPGMTLYMNRPMDEDTTVTLSYGDDSVLTGPATVLVPEGVMMVELELTGVAASTTPASVTASFGGVDAMAEVRVYDNTEEREVAAIDPADATITANGSATFTVTLNIPAGTGGQVVSLSADAGITAPADVTVAEGAFSADFDVTAGGDELTDLELTATIGASSASATVAVSSAPATGLIIAEVYYDHTSTQDDGNEWVKLYNGTGSSVDLSEYSLKYGGDDYNSWGNMDLSGTVAAGSCFLVGGGVSNIDLAQDFNPDIQNSGDTADAVGLFHSSESIPIDAVIYGGSNDNNLIDETGSVGAVDVGDAPAESSIAVTDSGWEIRDTPTPELCPPF